MSNACDIYQFTVILFKLLHDYSQKIELQYKVQCWQPAVQNIFLITTKMGLIRNNLNDFA